MSALFAASGAWRAAYPGAAAGLLVMEKVANPPAHPELERHKAELETRLRRELTRIQNETGPEVARRLRDDGADVAVMTPT